MILDHRAYITAAVVGYAGLVLSIALVGNDRWWKRVFGPSVGLFCAAAILGFLDWLWS